MELKVIRTEERYRAYLEQLQELLRNSASLTEVETERLELLSVIVEAHEREKYPIETPDPIDAIMFRMEEKGMRQADLVPYLGTKSRVSEILNRKRPLTVPMIRSLSVGLGISAETLVGAAGERENTDSNDTIDWSKFPTKEMISRGWIEVAKNGGTRSVERAVKDFFEDIGWRFAEVAFRKGIGGAAYSPTTKHALFAWLTRIANRANREAARIGKFERSELGMDFLRSLAQLSWFEDGPLLAIEFLQKAGIHVIIEPALKGTMLDGAALEGPSGSPIIGLTLRHDRLDNFWFTLLHEVVHVWKHIGKDIAFMDDLDIRSEDKREAEANRYARDAFIPRVAWKRSDVWSDPSKAKIERMAKELKIHPAIIAGRVRKENGNYNTLSDLVGYGEVRRLFWSDSRAVK